jgi:hypothetical protein
MMDPKSLSHRKERRILAVAEQHLRPLYWARRLGARARNDHQPLNVLVFNRQFHRLPPSCHDATPRSANPKRGIHKQTSGSNDADFMESVV